MVKKTDKVRELVKKKEYQKALAIARTFTLGIEKEERNAMVRAHECMTCPRFYQELGIDLDQCISEGVAVLKKLYG